MSPPATLASAFFKHPVLAARKPFHCVAYRRFGKYSLKKEKHQIADANFRSGPAGILRLAIPARRSRNAACEHGRPTELTATPFAACQTMMRHSDENQFGNGA
ncbi:MAG: hypothetical protein ABI318_07415 [Chthoniobacteraceae bacterium]